MSEDAIHDGLARMLASRDETAIGWKVGFATAEQMASLGTDLPLVGWLSNDRVVRSGATVEIAGWTNPIVEAEIAVRIGRDLPLDCDRATAAASIDAITSAIEIVDIDGPTDDPRVMLAGNVFHRGVVFGAWDAERAGADLTGVDLSVSGAAVTVEAVNPTAVLGDLVALVAGVARRLAQHGDRVRRGDLVITGAAVPPIQVRAGDEIAVTFSGLTPLSLRFT